VLFGVVAQVSLFSGTGKEHWGCIYTTQFWFVAYISF